MGAEEMLMGGMTGGVDDLYREVILDHFKSPRNKGRVPSPTVSNEGVNPMCGDEIEVTATLTNEVITDVKFIAQGCAISQASASMMTEILKGKPLAEARRIIQRFKAMLVPTETVPPGPAIELGDLEALEGVRKYAARVKCATLAWNTLSDALPQGKSKES